MIHIIKDYYLDADDNQYILIKWDQKRDKHGKPTNIDRSYYSNYDNLVNGLRDKLLRESIQATSTLGHLQAVSSQLSMSISDLLKTAVSSL